MVFTKRLREGVRRGFITCSVRIWKQPHVKVGGRYRMDEGEIVIDSTAQAAAAKAEHEAAESDRLRQQAEMEKQQLRQQLLQQLNAVLQTKDTDRGLVVTMADVLFDTGKYTLRPAAREKLAKLACIIIAHPGLKLVAEGHTDSTGTAEYNQRLYVKRAESVVEYLGGQGLAGDSLSASGFGDTRPVESNKTVAGRQQNRRVELIVSGEVIGTKIGTSPN